MTIVVNGSAAQARRELADLPAVRRDGASRRRALLRPLRHESLHQRGWVAEVAAVGAG